MSRFVTTPPRAPKDYDSSVIGRALSAITDAINRLSRRVDETESEVTRTLGVVNRESGSSEAILNPNGRFVWDEHLDTGVYYARCRVYIESGWSRISTVEYRVTDGSNAVGSGSWTASTAPGSLVTFVTDTSLLAGGYYKFLKELPSYDTFTVEIRITDLEGTVRMQEIHVFVSHYAPAVDRVYGLLSGAGKFLIRIETNALVDEVDYTIHRGTIDGSGVFTPEVSALVTQTAQAVTSRIKHVVFDTTGANATKYNEAYRIRITPRDTTPTPDVTGTAYDFYFDTDKTARVYCYLDVDQGGDLYVNWTGDDDCLSVYIGVKTSAFADPVDPSDLTVAQNSRVGRYKVVTAATGDTTYYVAVRPFNQSAAPMDKETGAGKDWVGSIYIPLITRGRGAWALSTAYLRGDFVSHNGSSYYCLVSHTSASVDEPGVGAGWSGKWERLAEKGSQGSAGSAGPQGDQGDQGGPGSPGAQGNQGNQGNTGTTGKAVASNGTGWIRAKHAGSWSPAGTTTQIDFTFQKNGADTCRDAKLVTLTEATGVLAVTDATHAGGDLNAATWTVTGSGTSSVTITAVYDGASVTQAVVAIQGGDQGNPGAQGTAGVDRVKWAGDFVMVPDPDGSQDDKIWYIPQAKQQVFKGLWLVGTTYLSGDLVYYGSDMYICNVASSTGSTPPSGHWTTTGTDPSIRVGSTTHTLSTGTPYFDLSSSTGMWYIFFDSTSATTLQATTSLADATANGANNDRVLVGMAKKAPDTSDYAWFVPIGSTSPILSTEILYVKDLQALFAQIDDLTIKDVLTLGAGGKFTNTGGDFVVDEDGITLDSKQGKWAAASIKWKDGVTEDMQIGPDVIFGAIQRLLFDLRSALGVPHSFGFDGNTVFDIYETYVLSWVPLRIPGSSAPGGSISHHVRYADTEDLPKGYVGTSGPVGIPITWYTQHTEVTVSNTLTETTLISTGNGKGTVTLPANHLVQGSTFRVRASGTMEDANALLSEMRWRVKLGGIEITTELGISFNPGTQDADPWSLDVDIVIASVSGTTAQARMMGRFMYRNGSGTDVVAPIFDTVTTSITSINTTRAFDVTVDMAGTADADAWCKCSNLTIEQLY